MYPVSANFHTLAIQDAPKTRVRIYFIGDGVDCTDDNDVQTNGTLLIGKAGDTDSNGRIGQNGVVFNELFNPDKNIQIGRAVSSQIGMTLLNTDGALDNFMYGRCKVYLDVYDTANSAWLSCPMGVYIIELPTKRKVQLINVAGFDQMTKLDAICDTWWNGLNWSGGLTLLQIVNSMAAQLGLSVSSNTASAIVNDSLSYTAAPFDCVEVTYREVLEYIAEATCTVARFDRNGALDLRWFDGTSPSVVINTNTVGNLCLAIDKAEYKVQKADLLRAKFAEGDIGVTVGSGSNEYVIQNNLFLNGANTAEITNKINAIYTRLNSLVEYYPINGRFIFDWSIEAGDLIYVRQGSINYTVPIFQSTMTWRGGYVVSDLISDGDKTRPVLDSAARDYYRLDSDMRTIVIEAPRINLLGYTTINDGFKVNLDGTFEANGATINGTVTTTDPAYGQTTLGNGVLEVKNLNGDTVAGVGSDENIGGVWTEAIGYGKISLDGEVLHVSDASHNARIVASGSGGYLAVYDGNLNRKFLVSSGNTIINNTILTDNGNPLNIKRDVDIVGSLDISGGGLNVSGNASVGGNVTVGGAVTASAFNGVKIEITQIGNNTTGAISFENSTSAILLCADVFEAGMFIASVRCNSSGAVSHQETKIGSGSIGGTFTPSTNTLSIANTSGGTMQILILRF